MEIATAKEWLFPFLGLVGVGVGFVLGQAKEWLTDRRRRRAWATASLVDLMWLENGLHEFIDCGTAGWVHGKFFARSLEAGLSEPRLLQAETLSATVSFLRQLESFTESVPKFRPEDRLAEWQLRCMAIGALKTIPQLQRALLDEGGTMPSLPFERWSVAVGELPPLPKRLFPPFPPDDMTPAGRKIDPA